MTDVIATFGSHDIIDVHEQFKGPGVRRYKSWLIAGVLLAAVIAGGVWWWRYQPLVVTTATVGRGPAVEAVYATGLVEPTVQMPVAPRTGGRLVQWLVEEGASVRRGQVLARLIRRWAGPSGGGVMRAMTKSAVRLASGATARSRPPWW